MYDVQFYKDNNSWQLYGKKLEVAEENDHLGLEVSSFHEELKNIDENIKSARDSLSSFLCNVFAYKCKLSKTAQYPHMVCIHKACSKVWVFCSA